MLTKQQKYLLKDCLRYARQAVKDMSLARKAGDMFALSMAWAELRTWNKHAREVIGK